jgi:transposase
MNLEDAIRELEETKADLAQQKRLVEGLQNQMQKLLNELAKRDKKDPPKRESKRDKKERREKAAAAKAAAAKAAEGKIAPEAPPRTERTGPDNADKGVPRRGPLPADVPRTTEHHSIADSRCCEAPNLVRGADKVIEQRDFIPARVAVRRVELEQWVCQCCEAVHDAPLPEIAVPTGSMTGRMLAHIASSKCAMHLPLIRIADQIATLGFTIASSTMSNAMGLVSDLLSPIYDRTVARLFARPLIQLDGTGMKVLQPGEKGTHRGQFMVYCDDELTVYGYSESKAAKHLSEFLRVGERDEYQGFVVADSANNMACLNDMSVRIRCGCWQHSRERFKAARVSAPKEAEEAIAWIGTFFDVEDAADLAGDTAEERAARRRRDTMPLIRRFWQWMAATQHRFDPGEDLYDAVQYCFNQRTVLQRFLTDGRIPLTNNRAETELGTIGRGRRGYLFAGSDASGHQLAKLYTVVRTCQRMAVAPFEYLAWVLPKLSDLPVNRGRGHLAQLVPWAYRDMNPTV